VVIDGVMIPLSPLAGALRNENMMLGSAVDASRWL
jgi:hypothetical protein